jgi:hypothetical protein
MNVFIFQNECITARCRDVSLHPPHHASREERMFDEHQHKIGNNQSQRVSGLIDDMYYSARND